MSWFPRDTVTLTRLFFLLYIRVSQPQPYWHLGSDDSLFCGSVLSILRCVAASLASTLEVPGAPPSSGDNQQYLQTLPNVPWGQNCPQLRTSVQHVHGGRIYSVPTIYLFANNHFPNDFFFSFFFFTDITTWLFTISGKIFAPFWEPLVELYPVLKAHEKQPETLPSLKSLSL